MTRVFIRWMTRGQWSRWHIKRPGRYNETLCGTAIAKTQQTEMTTIWTCDCSKCEHKRRQEEA